MALESLLAEEQQRESIATAEDVLSRLNDTERKIFLMRDKGVQTLEIASELDMEEATVYVHEHRPPQKNPSEGVKISPPQFGYD